MLALVGAAVEEVVADAGDCAMLLLFDGAAAAVCVFVAVASPAPAAPAVAAGATFDLGGVACFCCAGFAMMFEKNAFIAAECIWCCCSLL